MKRLEVGGTLRETFSIYRAQAAVLIPIALGLSLLVTVVTGVLLGNLAVGLFLLIESAVWTLYQGMVVGLVRDTQGGRRDFSAGDLIGSVRPVILPLIGAGLLSVLGTNIGLLFLIVPGLILMTIWAVIAPVIVVERSGMIAAFGRSRELVRDNGFEVFGVIFVAGAISAAAVFGLTTVSAELSYGIGMEILAFAIAYTLTAPIVALSAVTVYFRLLALKGEAPVGPSVGDDPLPDQA